MAGGGHASGKAVVATTIVMSCMATLFVALRIYARYAVAKNAGWDDGLIVVSSLFSWATTGIQIWQVSTGMGKHEWDLSTQQAEENRKALWTSIIVYNIGLTCTKMSILLQYQRIFPQKKFRIANWIMMAIVISYAIWRFFSGIFACVPVNAYWDHSIKNKTCLPRAAISFASTALNMATDIAIALLPLPLLNKLELPKRQRRTLMAVFALGGFVCVVSILRLQSLYVVMHTKDVSYNNGMAAIWSNIECNVGIVCSCLPTLRCLLPRIFRNRSYGLSGRSPGASGNTPSSSAKAEYSGRLVNGYPPMPARTDLDLAELGGAIELDVRRHGKEDSLSTTIDDVYPNRRPGSPADSTRELVGKSNDLV